MTPHIVVIKGIMTRDTFSRYYPMLSEFKSLEREHRLIIQALKSYYDQYPSADQVSADELQIHFKRENPSVKDSEIFDILFDQLRDLRIENKELLEDALKWVTDHHYSSLAMAQLLSFLNGDAKAGLSACKEHFDAFDRASDRVSATNTAESWKPLRQIVEEQQSNGLSWMLAPLNNIVGPLIPGALVHVFAPTETGKSTFAISHGAWWAHQLRHTDNKVLYLSNEEGADRIRARAYSAMLDLPVAEILAQPDDYYEDLYKRKGGGNLIISGAAHHISVVEEQIVRYKDVLRVVIIDQGPKVMVTGNHSAVEARQKIYNAYRDLANQYHIAFLSAGQADTKATGKKWLHYNHIDGSKVGIPGECDVIIGIGMDTADLNRLDYRYFNISKNKLGGKQERGLPRFLTKIDAPRNRYKVLQGG